MDWRAKIKTQPYLFHLEVPHIKAGDAIDMYTENNGDRDDARPNSLAAEAGKKVDDKKVILEAGEVVRKYRRESMGLAPEAPVPARPNAVPSSSPSSSPPSSAAAAAAASAPAASDSTAIDVDGVSMEMEGSPALTSPAGGAASKGDQRNSTASSASSVLASGAVKIALTYADLVKTALADMHQQRRISLPIWCHDNSASFGGHVASGGANHDVVPSASSRGGEAAAAAAAVTLTPVRHSMVTFISEYPELVKQRLAVNIGLGTKVGAMNMLPVTISKRADPNYAGELHDEPGDGGAAGAAGVGAGADPHHHEKVAQDGFFASIQARLVVEQVVEGVRGAATFSFDYLMLVLVAASLAAVGLASNNTVVIVASMLVSPIMGPILAITFGAMIEKGHLVKMGIINECISLFLCVLVGFVFAWILIACGAHNEWAWPTNEMGGRGTLTGILTGIAIATPSGIGVALSILSNNTSSLVGVAISASLLPPAVNAGMMWAYAIFIATTGDSVEKPGWMHEKNFIGSPTNATSSYVPQDPGKISMAGFVSLLLTLLNIALILVTACAMFWCKSVVKYDGEGAEWQDEYKKYKAANYVVKNDDQGRLLAKRAKWVAKFSKALPGQRGDKKQSDKCCGMCPGGGANVHDVQLTQRSGGGTGPGNNGPVRTSLAGNSGGGALAPHQGRPAAVSDIFGLPPTPSSAINGFSGSGSKRNPAADLALADGIAHGHRTLNRMLSMGPSAPPPATVDQPTPGATASALLHTTSMAHAPSPKIHSHPRRRSAIADSATLAAERFRTLNTPRSLFGGRRRAHEQSSANLAHTLRAVTALQKGHGRQLSHSQYADMAALFDNKPPTPHSG